MKLIKKLIGRYNVDENIDDMIKDVNGFYIPNTTTLNKVVNRQKLNQDETEDYINYIIKNYLIRDNMDILAVFGSEWVKYSVDQQLMQRRQDTALINIINELKNGNSINILDALWISKNIYVDDIQIERKRIISKCDGVLTITANKRNPEVNNQINALKKALNQQKIIKNVDKSL